MSISLNSASPTNIQYEHLNSYTATERAGVIAIISAGAVSALAVLCTLLALAATAHTRARQQHFLHTAPLLASLLVADLLQAVGSLMNTKWLLAGAASPGGFCSAQGGIKQAGNVAIAVWVLLMAVNSFELLFRRSKPTLAALATKLALGWLFVVLVVGIPPVAIRNQDLDPYFGVSGLWCWITASYPLQRILLEYVFEFISAGVSLALYTAILLRVRGNLVPSSSGRWHLRLAPAGGAPGWTLALTRDVLDSAALSLARAMLWYPLAYLLLLTPITAVRFVEFTHGSAPFWALAPAAVLFNLTGLVDALLLLAVRRRIPDTTVLPALSTKRPQADAAAVPAAFGITPFDLAQPTEKLERVPSAAGSMSSVDSRTPLKLGDDRSPV